MIGRFIIGRGPEDATNKTAIRSTIQAAGAAIWWAIQVL